ncbi:MAG: hypothetical protein PHI31_08150 [Desulfuromonadaceae bacterium]|nr:hypothetical protein [Desulfuromonadaceae bacterium]
MSGNDKEHNDLERLLADVQRTIRENDQFIRHLKEESSESDHPAESEEEPESESDEYEEL